MVFLRDSLIVGTYDSTNRPSTNWWTREDLPTDREPKTAIFLALRDIMDVGKGKEQSQIRLDLSAVVV